MRPFTRFMSWILLTGALLSLDGILYARTPNDVMLIMAIFVSVADGLVVLIFRRRSSINETTSNLGRDRVPLVEN